MIQDIKDQNDDVTINSRQIAVLKEYFPACFSADGSFDITRFQEEIKDKADVVHEGYELKFLGKSYAKLLASTDTTTILMPDEAHNSLPENADSENIYISGDNLDGLKHLLKSYQNSIKCIYIDPPYNTGSDGFVYQDNFNYTIDNLQEKLNVSEDEAQRILDLTKRGSASHSAWLMFMYCRLLLARDVLSQDGVIFISIDDNEQANLKLLCDDVFGEENFIANLIWANKEGGGSSDSRLFRIKHESIIVYGQNISDVEISGNAISNVDRYKSTDKYLESRGPYYLQKLGMGSIQYSISLDYSITTPDGSSVTPSENNNGKKACWRWSQNKLMWGLENDFVVFNKDKNNIWTVYTKQYLNCDNEGNLIERSQRPLGIIDHFSSTQAAKMLDSMGLGLSFSYSKPLALIIYLISKLNDKDLKVLDFFSGSATTSHAVMQLNAEDGGKRRFIAVQLPEVLSKEDNSQKAAYEFLEENDLPTTLDYIGIERIKRAAAKIKAEQADKKENKEGDLFESNDMPALDLGFKHYTLVEPNQNTLDKLESFDKANFIVDTTILDDFGKPAVLATWLNADGYGLTVNAEQVDLAGYPAYYYQKHLYLIDEGFTLESMKALLAKYDAEGSFNPENLVLFGYSFPAWSITEMIEKNLRILNDGEKNLKINYTVRY